MGVTEVKSNDWLDAKEHIPDDNRELKIRWDSFELTAYSNIGRIFHAKTNLPIILRIKEWKYV